MYTHHRPPIWLNVFRRRWKERHYCANFTPRKPTDCRRRLNARPSSSRFREALLVALSSRNPSWELGAAATLAPWNWSAATTEQLLLEEHIRCQMARTNATPSVASSDSGGQSSVDFPCIAPCLVGTVSSSASRPSGADEGVLDVQISGDRRLLVRVTLFASGFVIGARLHDCRGV